MALIVPILYLLLGIGGLLNSVSAGDALNVVEKPVIGALATEDPYQGVPYQERPLASDSVKVLSVDDLLRTNLPTFWKSRKSISTVANVGDLAQRRNEVDMLEKDLLSQIQGIPGIPELIEENRNLEAEIQNFLTLRRAELKDLHKQIKILETDLDAAKQVKAHDISELQNRIQGLYDDIDTHLESPEASYNDTYVLERKNRIKKLLRKKKTLNANLNKLNDPTIKRLTNRLEFLQERRREIHDSSRDLSFKYVQKRMDIIEKNNSRINYIVNINSDREQTKRLKSKMAKVRQLRSALDTARQNLKSSEPGQVDMETEIRFEEKYYDRVAERESEILEDIRRSRQRIREGASAVSADKVISIQTEEALDKGEKAGNAATAQQQSHVIVVPLKEGMDISSVGKLPQVLMQNPKFKSAQEGTVIYMSEPSGESGEAKELIAHVQRDLEEQNLRLSRELSALRASLETLHKTMLLQQRSIESNRVVKPVEQILEKQPVEKRKVNETVKVIKSNAVTESKTNASGFEAAIQADLEASDRMGL